jgi:hypothetical protein
MKEEFLLFFKTSLFNTEKTSYICYRIYLYIACLQFQHV